MYRLSVETDDYTVEGDGPGSNTIFSEELIAYQDLGGLIGLPSQAATFTIDGRLHVELTCERNVEGKIDFSILHDGDLFLMAAYSGPFSMRVFAKEGIDYIVELAETSP